MSGAIIELQSIATIIFWAAFCALAYALMLYPLLMRCCTWWAGRRYADFSVDLPTISFIIPAHNEEAILDAKLTNTLALDYPREKLEIIVASDGSTDQTVQIACRYALERVRVLDLHPNRGKATALNEAVLQAHGEVLCLCDANVMFRPDCLQRMVAHLSDPGVGAVSGDVRLASEESDFELGEVAYYRLERRVHLGESRIGSMLGVDGGMYVLRRELYRPLLPDTILDDFTTSIRVIQQGQRIVYEPAAIATENGTPTWQQEFRRRVRVMRGAVQSVRRRMWPPVSRPVELWQYVSHKLLRWLGPVWLIALIVSPAWLWNAGLLFRAAFIGQIGFYIVAVAAWAVPALRGRRLGGVAFYFTMSHAAMAVGLWKGLVSKPSGRWERTERTAAPAAHLPGHASIAGENAADSLELSAAQSESSSIAS